MWTCGQHHSPLAKFALNGPPMGAEVAQNIAKEPTLYDYGPIYIGGPLKAYWARGASQGPNILTQP